jgi:hypothetical protein
MADISAQGIPDFGNLLTSFPRNEASIANTQATTGLAQAQTGLAGAQTGLFQQQTQKAAFEVQMIKNAMEAMKNLPSGGEQSGEQPVADPTETGIASSLNSKMYVDQNGPPAFNQYIKATAWVNPAESQRVSDQRDLYVKSQIAKNQNEANDIFQTSTSLANSNAGLDTLLKTTHPGTYLNNVGKAIASMQDKTPQEKDDMARTAIQSAAKYSHQYTGRDVDYAGDQPVDKNTKFPVIAPKEGPTAGEQIDIGKWSNTPQTVTIDNRETTIKPKDLGINSYADLTKNKSVKFSVAPPGAPKSGVSAIQPGQTTTPPGAPSSPTSGGGQPMTPQQARNAPISQGGAPVPGLTPEQSDFVKQQPQGIPSVASNQKLNADDMNQRNIYRKQSEDLSKATNLEYARATDVVTHIKQIQNLLNTPGLTLGPGAPEYAQMKTVLNQWFGTAPGQAGAFQVLSKVLNTTEMNDLLQQFHSEGAQVRLGAYESKLIMDKLTASPALTKEAIQQMLQWQGSDSQYTMQKAKVAGALTATGKSVANFDKDYGEKFPKQDIVDTTIKALNPNNAINFDAAKGKTYTSAEVSRIAAKHGYPLVMFQDQLQKAGAIIK